MTDTTDPFPGLTDLLGRAARDPALRERLLADPRAVLHSESLELREGLRMHVVANTAQRVHLVLPPLQAEALSDAVLDSVAGGADAHQRGRPSGGHRPLF